MNDALFNLPHQKGLFWFIYGRLLKSTGGPRVTAIGRLLMVKDKRAYAGWLRARAGEAGLRRVIVAHGEPIEGQPADALRAVARSLDGQG